MSASVIEGLTGEEADESEAAARVLETFSVADPLASAIAVEAAEVAETGWRSEAVAYLRAQKALVDLQVRHFEPQRRLAREERLLAIDAARRKRFADRLKNAVQLLVTLGAAVIAVAVIILIRDAVVSRGVVVEPFKTPPALAPRGVSGEVVAAGLLDELEKLQAATRSAARGPDVRSAWSSDVRIEVPQTGVSMGEIDRLLRQRLGHDSHIGGDLVQSETGGLVLTVRGDGVPTRTFEGGTGDLARLTRAAAEYAYGRSQPVRFATYLIENSRNADALGFLPGAIARSTDDGARAKLENDWGIALASLNRPSDAIAKYRAALTLQPYYWTAWVNLSTTLLAASGEEAGWRESAALLRAAEAAPAGRKPEFRLLQNPAQTMFDWPLALASYLKDAKLNAGAGASLTIDGPAIAMIYVYMHDQPSAARYLALSDPNDPSTKATGELLTGQALLDAGTPAAAVPPLEAYWKSWQADAGLQQASIDGPCAAGLAFGLTGRTAEAEAVFKRIGPWSLCYAAHGDELEHAGDLAGAERVWAEGLRAAPDLPTIYLRRGLSELRRADLSRAAADFAAANGRAPHFADPLKGWGDVLARQGRWKEARAKYREALRYAPVWPELKRAEASAATRSG
jgi:tetratricopeptide (TPR) repeat protein